MENPDSPGDEITIDPIPVPRAMAAIAGRVRRVRLAGAGRRLMWRAWLLAAIAAVAVIGALKLAGVIWTSAPPRWVPALGAGVTVTGPGQVAPGHGSPGAAVAGAMAALAAKDPVALCDYAYVGPVARCAAQLRQTSRNQLPYSVSVKIGYVATDGTRALVGVTGRICSPGSRPECATNTDPAAIFSAGDTFAALWTRTVNPNSSSTYSLLPCVEVGGKWYLAAGSGS
jgi:hypothetical protein